MLFWGYVLPQGENDAPRYDPDRFTNEEVKQMQLKDIPIWHEHNEKQEIGRVLYDFVDATGRKCIVGKINTAKPLGKLHAQRIQAGELTELSLQHAYEFDRHKLKYGIWDHKKMPIEVSVVNEGRRKNCIILGALSSKEGSSVIPIKGSQPFPQPYKYTASGTITASMSQTNTPTTDPSKLIEEIARERNELAERVKTLESQANTYASRLKAIEDEEKKMQEEEREQYKTELKGFFKTALEKLIETDPEYAKEAFNAIDNTSDTALMAANCQILQGTVAASLAYKEKAEYLAKELEQWKKASANLTQFQRTSVPTTPSTTLESPMTSAPIPKLNAGIRKRTTPLFTPLVPKVVGTVAASKHMVPEPINPLQHAAMVQDSWLKELHKPRSGDGHAYKQFFENVQKRQSYAPSMSMTNDDEDLTDLKPE